MKITPVLTLVSILSTFNLATAFAQDNELTYRKDTDIGLSRSNDGGGISAKVNFELRPQVLSPEKTEVLKNVSIGSPFGITHGTTTWTKNVISSDINLNMQLGGAQYTEMSLNVFDLNRFSTSQKTLGPNGKEVATFDSRVGRFGMTGIRDFNTGFNAGGLIFTGGDSVFSLVADLDFQSAVTGQIKVAQVILGTVDERVGIAFQPIEIKADYKHKIGEQTLSIGGDIGAWFAAQTSPQVHFDKRIALERINGGNVGVFYENSKRWGNGEKINVNRIGVTFSAN